MSVRLGCERQDRNDSSGHLGHQLPVIQSERLILEVGQVLLDRSEATETEVKHIGWDVAPTFIRSPQQRRAIDLPTELSLPAIGEEWIAVLGRVRYRDAPHSGIERWLRNARHINPWVY